MIPPSGQDSLSVREAYLRHRHHQRFDRGWAFFWVAAGALVAWLFIAAFAGLGH